MSKKIDERKVLEQFKKAIGLNFNILDTTDAQKYFPQYNDENPDFIVSFEGKFIGVELFRLCLTRSEENIEYGGKQYKNYMQKKSDYPDKITLQQAEELMEKIRLNPEKYPLTPQDNITPILNERISQKMKKLDNYVTSTNWFLGYANEECNMDIIKEIYEYKIQEKMKEIINVLVKENNRNVTNKISRVMLFEPDGQNLWVDTV